LTKMEAKRSRCYGKYYRDPRPIPRPKAHIRMVRLEVTLTAGIVKATSSIKASIDLEKLGDEEPGENYRDDSCTECQNAGPTECGHSAL